MKSSIRHIILLLIVFYTNTYAQQPFAWQLGEDDGLPSAEIYGLYQDSKGYMWIGTDGGICKYNGISIKSYTAPNSKGTSTAAISEDSRGRIWFKNFSKQLFYINQDNSAEFKLPNINGIDPYFRYFFIDSILVIEGRDLYLYNPTKNTWKTDSIPIEEKPTLGKSCYGWLRGVTSDNLFINFEGNFLQYKKNEGFSSHGRIPSKVAYQEKWFVKSYAQDTAIIYGQNTIYINSYSKLTTLETKSIIGSISGDIYEVYIDNQKNIWVGTTNGAYFFKRLLGNKFAPAKHFFPKQQISAFFHDREGSYWLGTLHNGVFIIPSIDIVYYNKSNSNLSSSQINKIQPAYKNYLLLGQSNGIVSKFSIHNSSIEDEFNTQTTKNINNIFFEEENQQLLAITPLIYQFNWNKPKDVIFKRFSQAKYLIRLSKDILLRGDNNGAKIIIPHIGSAKIPDNYKKFSLKTFKKTLPNGIETTRSFWGLGRVNAMYKEKEGSNRIWIAYDNHLLSYGNAKIDTILSPSKTKITAFDICKTQDSIIWVCTVDQGVLGIKNQKAIIQYNIKNGLRTNSCKTISSYQNNLWVGSQDGINYIDRTTNKIQLYNKLDGLVSDKIRDIVVQDNSTWAATSKGLIEIKPWAQSKNKVPPLIHLNSPIVNNELVVDTTVQAIFTYNKNNISFSFQGLSLRSRGSFTYEYRLLGLDDDWVELPNSTNFVRFQGLQSKKYTFEVKVKNEDKICSLTTRSYSFSITPPYWQTWWFYILIFLLVLGAIVGIVILRYQVVRNQDMLKHANQQLSMQALQAQMNPHFVFNSMTAIQSFWMAKKRKKALIYHAQFAKLMRLIFEYSREIAINIEKEIEFLKIYIGLEQIRFENQVDVDYLIDEALFDSNISIPPLLIQPIVENSFKHGFLHKEDMGKLIVELKQEGKFIYCRIEDNGVGIDVEQFSENWKNSQKEECKSSQKVTQERLLMLQKIYVPHSTKKLFIITNLNNKDIGGTGFRTEIWIPTKTI